jgi:diphthamide biosynthesis protein 3
MFLDASPALNEYEPRSLQNRQQEASLLNRDIQTFHDKTLHALMSPLSESITSWLNNLRSIAEVGASAPTTNTSSSSSSNIPTMASANQSRPRIKSRLSIGSRKIQPPRLSIQVDERIKKVRQTQVSDLPASRNKVAMTAANLLAARGEAMERMIVLLERTKYGSLSRGTKARADYLATVAECMNYKVQYVSLSVFGAMGESWLIVLSRVTKLEALSTIYTPENIAALEKYSAHLRETLSQLEETRDIANQTLEEYDQVGASGNNRRGKSGPMADIARRYGDLAQEVDAVQKEIKKLKI